MTIGGGGLPREQDLADVGSMTRAFSQTIQARAAVDPAFRAALLTEGGDALISGDVDTGRAVLRDDINATVGFEKLAEATGMPGKSLMRMFGPKGNPNAKNLFSVIGVLQEKAGVSLHVEVERQEKDVAWS
jgi:DNA-binding phage protein